MTLTAGTQLRNRLTGDRAEVTGTREMRADDEVVIGLAYRTGPLAGRSFIAGEEWLVKVFDPAGLPS